MARLKITQTRSGIGNNRQQNGDDHQMADRVHLAEVEGRGKQQQRQRECAKAADQRCPKHRESEAKLDNTCGSGDSCDIEAERQLRMRECDRRDPARVEEFFHRRPEQRQRDAPSQAVRPERAHFGIGRDGECEIDGEPEKDRIIEHMKQAIAGDAATVEDDDAGRSRRQSGPVALARWSRLSVRTMPT